MASVLAASLVISAAPVFAANSGGTRNMYRLYNPNSGEHFYTAAESERDNLTSYGWRYEGIGWVAPEMSDTPVYRLYNKNAGDHHYTVDPAERDNLVNLGWNLEGIGWYSDDNETIPLYRQYNPNAKSGSHNYTTSLDENNQLVGLGWRAEGIGWYAVGGGTPVQSGGQTSGGQTSGGQTSGGQTSGGQSSGRANTGTVYWTPNGKRYHSTPNCPSLGRSRTILSGSISEAGSRTPCKDCW